MEVFPRYFARLVAQNAATIFPGSGRPPQNSGDYSILAGEMDKISHDLDQAGKIAESIETGTDNVFRNFDLSTFMEHFKLDALEKTILALAFKFGSDPNLKTKGMFQMVYRSIISGSKANTGHLQPMPSFPPTFLPL